MADGDYLSKKDDVEKVFGKENIKRWANADNEEDLNEIANRIDWANSQAQTHFLGRMAEGPYNLTDILTTKPKMAIYICAHLAGVYLYDTRRVVDSGQETNRVAAQEKRANLWIRRILGGQLKLINPTTNVPILKNCQNSPDVITSTSST